MVRWTGKALDDDDDDDEGDHAFVELTLLRAGTLATGSIVNTVVIVVIISALVGCVVWVHAVTLIPSMPNTYI